MLNAPNQKPDPAINSAISIDPLHRSPGMVDVPSTAQGSWAVGDQPVKAQPELLAWKISSSSLSVLQIGWR